MSIKKHMNVSALHARLHVSISVYMYVTEGERLLSVPRSTVHMASQQGRPDYRPKTERDMHTKRRKEEKALGPANAEDECREGSVSV